MAKKGAKPKDIDLPPDWKPKQAVPDPILNKPYEEPGRHWVYAGDGLPHVANGRRPASYFFTTQRIAAGQGDLLAEEKREELPLVNMLRADVARWRGSDYRGATKVTRDLLTWWKDPIRVRRMFFCQVEAIETLIYLLEIAIPGRLSATGFSKLEVNASLLSTLLAGGKPPFAAEDDTNWARLVDASDNPDELALRRLGCKMATGSGKTAVMAMLITWAFINRARNPASTQFPNAVLVCAPNLNVRERLQVLKPEHPGNSFDYFDLVPKQYRDLLGTGKVLITNWHALALKSENREGDKSYRVVQKGEETPGAFTMDRLGDLAPRLPILVLNDEGHHCWRPNPTKSKAELPPDLSAEELKRLEEDREEARVWLAGLDRINNCGIIGKSEDGRHRAGVLACIDLSATPFYLSNSGYPEGSPFPWLVADFGLVDAIECGIVKIPRLPVADDKDQKDEAGKPDPKYFRLWRNIVEHLKPADRVAGRPKPPAIYRDAEGALKTLASQWKIQFDKIQSENASGDFIPPVMIVVCDNTAIADLFYQKISGESPRDVEEDVDEETDDGQRVQVEKVTYGTSDVLKEFENAPGVRHSVRIDSDLLAKIETSQGETKDEAAQRLRELIATVGKRGQPGAQVRCVVSVSMLTEGWDASNVTHVLGVRAFGSQLLCEQVVGRGLRRMSYDPNPETGMLQAEYVDVYGIPFSLIPFKGKPKDDDTPDPVYHRIYSVPERKHFEIRVPVVESYTYDVRESGIQCDVNALPEVHLKDEPTKVWLTATRGYQDDAAPIQPGETVEQTRDEYYKTVRPQQVVFRVAQQIVEDLIGGAAGPSKTRGLARHQIFPEVVSILQRYIASGKIKPPAGADIRELAITRNADLVRERIREAIVAGVSSKDHPLLPVVSSYAPYVTTDGVDEQTARPIQRLTKSHLNAAIVLSGDERKAIDMLEELDCIDCFAPNSRKVGIQIPYRYEDAPGRYEPDFVVRLRNGRMLVLEIKGEAGLIHGDSRDKTEAKTAGTTKWIAAINNAKRYGEWAYVFCDDISQLRSQIGAHAPAGTGPALPFRNVEPKSGDHFKICVPLTSLRAAAGKFSEDQLGFDELVQWAQEWITWNDHPRFEEGMFVARVRGRSMEPEIPDGSYCLFAPPTGGSRQGRRVLVWLAGISDAETGGQFTLKVYTSEKAFEGEGWHHTKVTLKPINPDFDPIVFTAEDEGDVRVVAEVVAVLPGTKTH